ncbi:serine hydrolase domain-containing protein [Microbulbifer hydrolyticus]|uniref:D-alanyl-D-alanine carboxypeptidase n=1 Tax=Microbulbifer hydrolyticus TaxID=48074 RepID=A0A6P1TAI2_9GAMM|nr:serine hydrolase [Microbulbifer hydrolyticus]MBB5212115.1 D-alanyl-D-alanine carboxypeptidase [Microbulbifer hydrolyticus]QHQ39788.1 serine hydrolase [Microbulbifer hydrolyticus]
MPRQKLFSTVRLRDLALLIVSISVLVISAHLWISDRLLVLRSVYPLESMVSRTTLTCSPGAPVWLGETLLFATESQGSLANQIAYIEPDGKRHHCENGWEGTLIASPRLSETTRFRYASLSKLITADATLAIINSGGLRLDAALVEIFPELVPSRDARLREVTIGHLLSHQAGFDRMKSEDPLFSLRKNTWCPYDIKALSSQMLDFSPGERYSYSNRGYCLLGAVLEKVTGKPFRQLIEEMYSLSDQGVRFIDGPYLKDEVRYDFRNGDFFSERYYQRFDFHALSAVAGLSGNASALAQLIHSMLRRQPLNILSATVGEGCDLSEYMNCYGYGVYVHKQSNSQLSVSMQGGVLPGSRSVAVIDEHGGVTVLLGSGQPLEGFEQTVKLYQKMYYSIEQYYKAGIAGAVSLPLGAK